MIVAYDSASKKEKELEVPGGKNAEVRVSLSGPLGFWIGILVVAALIQLVAIPFATQYGNPSFNSYLNTFANYVLYIPGLIVLPLIASVWIGDHVSNSIGNRKKLLVSKGLINALYSALIYTITVFIIYVVMQYAQRGALAAVGVVPFLEYLVAVPFAIVIVIVPIFALLSASRHYG